MLGSVGVLEGHEHTLVEKLLINGDTILLGHQHLGELWKKDDTNQFDRCKIPSFENGKSQNTYLAVLKDFALFITKANKA